MSRSSKRREAGRLIEPNTAVPPQRPGSTPVTLLVSERERERERDKDKGKDMRSPGGLLQVWTRGLETARQTIPVRYKTVCLKTVFG